MDPNLDEMLHARLHRDLNISQVCTTLLVLGFSAIIAFADLTSDEGKLALAVSVGVAYAFLLFNITGTIDEVKATIKDNEKMTQRFSSTTTSCRSRRTKFSRLLLRLSQRFSRSFGFTPEFYSRKSQV